jgi:hypothetical protein
MCQPRTRCMPPCPSYSDTARPRTLCMTKTQHWAARVPVGTMHKVWRHWRHGQIGQQHIGCSWCWWPERSSAFRWDMQHMLWTRRRRYRVVQPRTRGMRSHMHTLSEKCPSLMVPCQQSRSPQGTEHTVCSIDHQCPQSQLHNLSIALPCQVSSDQEHMRCKASMDPCRRPPGHTSTTCTSVSRSHYTVQPHRSHMQSPTMHLGPPCPGHMLCTSSHQLVRTLRRRMYGTPSMDLHRGRTCLQRMLCSCPYQCLSTYLEHSGCYYCHTVSMDHGRRHGIQLHNACIRPTPAASSTRPDTWRTV